MPSKFETIPTLHVNQQLPGENPAEVFAKLGRGLPMVLLDANDLLESADLIDPTLQATFKSFEIERWRDSELFRKLPDEQAAQILQVATVALEHLSGVPMIVLQPKDEFHHQYSFTPVTDPEQLELAAYRNVDSSKLDIKVASVQPGLARTVYGATILLGGAGKIRAAVADVLETPEGNLFRAPKVMTHEAEAVSPVTILGYIAQAPRDSLQEDEPIRPTAYGIVPIPIHKYSAVTVATVFGLASEWQQITHAHPTVQ